MPLKVRRFSASLILVLLGIFGVSAQTQSSVTPTNILPTSADVMRARISKAKAYVAVKNYAAAIYELEGIRREISDPSVNGVVQVMLMNCYLEQMDYKRAQTFLTEIFTAQKANKPNTNYFAVAGQVVKGAKNQLERYRSLGLSVADRNLPTEAAADVNKMRETVEMVVDQSKTLGADKKLTADSMALLEEASTVRSNLGRDDYDARRWKEEVADARENLANSRSTIINAVDDSNSTPVNTTSPVNTGSVNPNTTLGSNQKPVVTQNPADTNPAKIIPVSTETKPAPNEITNNSNPQTQAKNTDGVEKPVEKANETPVDTNKQVADNAPKRNRVIEKAESPKVEETAKKDERKTDTQEEVALVKNVSPLSVGSLLEYATERVNPTYPPAAKTVRMTGTVHVEVVVNEDGKVEIQNTSGPSMLQRAALDAIKKWKFKPFVRDGQPVKATGYVNFSFNL